MKDDDRQGGAWHRGEGPHRGPIDDGDRPLWPALVRGWRGRCPNCGGGPILESYLRVRDHCTACGEALHHHRADDFPAWATILIVGHVVGFGLFHVELSWRPPSWVHWAIWPALAAGLTIWLLPRIKGAVVAMQWAKRLHGFGGEDGDGPGGSSAP